MADVETIKELLDKWDADATPESRAADAKAHAEWNAKPCRYDSVRECWEHGYFPRRPCGHVCHGVPCSTCKRLATPTGRQRTRARWRRQGRR